MNQPRFFLVASAVLLLFAGHASAGNSPDGFVDVPWRATLSEAKLILLGREDVRLKEETPERLVLTGGIYTGHPVERWEFEFVAGSFQRGTVYLSLPPGTAADGRPVVDHQFDDFFRALTAKYGPSSAPGRPNAAERVWKWTVADPHTGNRNVRSILLSYQWSGPLIFKVQYADRAPDVSQPAPATTPIKSNDL